MGCDLVRRAITTSRNEVAVSTCRVPCVTKNGVGFAAVHGEGTRLRLAGRWRSITARAGVRGRCNEPLR